MSILKKLRRLKPFHYRTLHPPDGIDLGVLADLPSGFNPTNPSIAPIGNGYLVSIRGVNYTITDDKRMTMSVPDGSRVASETRFVLVDAEWRCVSRCHALDRSLAGAEDVRLFRFGDRICASYTRQEDVGQRGCSMMMAEVADDMTIVEQNVLRSPFGFRQEKNWSPFVHAGQIHFVYSFEPLVVVRFVPQRQDLEFVGTVTASEVKPRLHFVSGGSSAGLETEHGWLFVVHQRSARLPALRKIYVHRWALLDASLDRVRFSPSFVIDRPEIQFVNGAALAGRKIFVSFGRRDHEASLVSFDRDAVLSGFR